MPSLIFKLSQTSDATGEGIADIERVLAAGGEVSESEHLKARRLGMVVGAGRRYKPIRCPEDLLRRRAAGELDFPNADLGSADLTGAELRDASLRGADLVDANLSSADLRGANFNHAYLQGANLRGADLRGADLGDAHLTGADLEDVDLRETKVLRASFGDLTQGGTNLCGVNLSGTDMRGASLQAAKLIRANLSGTKLGQLPGREGHRFSSNLAGADLEAADLRGADLSNADLQGANLRGALLEGANLSRARLDSASFDALSFQGLLAPDTVLVDASANAATLERSDFSPQDFGLLMRKGLRVIDLPAFDTGVLSRLFPGATGLALYFNSRLEFVNETVVRAVLASCIRSSDCCCSVEPASKGMLVRLSGLEEAELLALADRLHAFFSAPAEALIELAIQRTLSTALPPAVDSALERSLDARLPPSLSKAIDPLVAAQLRLSQGLIDRIEMAFGQVQRTEIQLSKEVTDALNRLEDDILDQTLGMMEFSLDRKAGRLVREGAWAIGTGAAGSGLYAAIAALMKLAGT